MNSLRLEQLQGVVLAAGAGMAYWLTMGSGPSAGEPARLLSQAVGYSEAPTTLNPLWALMVGIAARVSPADLAGIANWLSLICGALSVGLLYHLVTSTLLLTIEIDDRNETWVRAVSTAGGIAASLALAFSIPFWYAAVRCYPATWHLLLLLILTEVFLVFARRPSLWGLSVFWCLAGIGVVEFTTTILFLPLFAAYGVVILWRNERLEWKMFLAAAAGFAVGLLLYLFAAWRYVHDPSVPPEESVGLLRIVGRTMRLQYNLLAGNITQLGWLVLIIGAVAPWLVVVATCRRALNETADAGMLLLYMILTGVSAAVLSNTRVAPWMLYGPQNFVVTPYVLVAAGYGYLTAFWCIAPYHLWSDREGWQQKAMPAAAVLFAVLMLALPILAAFDNLRTADARSSTILDRFCREVVADMGGRRWLVTDGSLDDNILIAAAAVGRDIDILNLALGNHDFYLRRVASKFKDPNLKNLAQVGLPVLLQEWFKAQPSAAGDAAVLNVPDIWYAAGLTPIPNRTVYLGLAPGAALDAAALAANHVGVWKEWIAALDARSAAADQWRAATAYLRRHMSMLANNLGVVLEDRKLPGEAWNAYAAARRLNPDNLSALLNQYVMIQNGYAAADKARVVSATEAIMRQQERRPSAWRLTRVCGYVRMPEVFADIGVTWALSGQPGMAVSGLKRAIDLSGAGSDRFKRTLAIVYAAQDQQEQGAALLEDMITRKPGDSFSLIALARIRARQGDFARAQELLNRAAKTKVSRDALALEWGSVYLLGGQTDRARIILQEAVELNPHNVRAWALLGAVALESKDERGIEECYQALNRESKLDATALSIRGQIEIHRRKFEAGRQDLERALALAPNNIPLLEQLLRIFALIGRPDLAEQRVRQLLTIDPDNASGNYFMGSLQIRRGDLLLAENSFRKSIAKTRMPMALNDLAWLLHLRGQNAEAETFVREALEANPKQAAAHDTLGVILMKTGRASEAEKSFRAAMALNSADMTVHIHLAEALVQLKQREKARQIVTSVLDRAKELAPDDRDRLMQLRRELVPDG